MIDKYRKYITLLIIILSCYLVSQHIIQFALIQGESMQPNLHKYQLVLVNKWKKEINRNDIIIFECKKLKLNIIKRVIGVPGDTIQIFEGTVYINGISQTNVSYIEDAGIASNIIELNDDEYFVMGDNSKESIDSRYESVGNVKRSAIKGVIIR